MAKNKQQASSIDQRRRRSVVAEELVDGRGSADDATRRSCRNDVASTSATGDVVASLLEERRCCDWCARQLPATQARGRFCGQICRQAAFRIRRRGQVETRTNRPLRFAYADPPYPGTAKRYYQHEATYGGEVDHAKLIASLSAGNDGWALSTSAKALRDVLPLCPPAARVCSWVKPIGTSPLTYGIHNQWEPLIVVAGRHRRPGKRDWLAAQPARRGGTLMGRKPVEFCAWLFALLGMLPGDELVDVFPGTGIVTRCWDELCRASSAAADDVA